MPSSGGEPRQIVDVFSAEPDYSPDGLLVAFTGFDGQNLETFVVPRDGSAAPTQLTFTSLPVANRLPEFLPDQSQGPTARTALLAPPRYAGVTVTRRIEGTPPFESMREVILDNGVLTDRELSSQASGGTVGATGRCDVVAQTRGRGALGTAETSITFTLEGTSGDDGNRIDRLMAAAASAVAAATGRAPAGPVEVESDIGTVCADGQRILEELGALLAEQVERADLLTELQLGAGPDKVELDAEATNWLLELPAIHNELSLDGGLGDDALDVFVGAGGPENLDLELTIKGGVGDDFLESKGPEGTGASRVALGLTIRGNAGNDFIQSKGPLGTGTSVLDGGAGDDSLEATGTIGTGSVMFSGGPGKDLMRGDIAPVGAGGQQRGPFGAALVIRYLGGGGDDRLLGGKASEIFVGGGGIDAILAGAGNDAIQVRDGKRDVVNGGAGRDTATADRLDSVTQVEILRRK
jgi:hypothetical protein